MNLTLFRIEGYATRDRKIALLPGVPRRLFVHPEVRALRQGSVVQLCLPDGTASTTEIADYYIETLTTPKKTDLDKAPIILVLPEDVSAKDVPIGTEVQISVSDHSE